MENKENSYQMVSVSRYLSNALRTSSRVGASFIMSIARAASEVYSHDKLTDKNPPDKGSTQVMYHW